jgi:hypothetical protein
MVLEFELENVFIKICSDRGDVRKLRKRVQVIMSYEMVEDGVRSSRCTPAP